MNLEELKNILLSDKPSELLKIREADLFKFIPELETCKDFDQKNEWHPYDVLEHIYHVVDYVPNDLSLRLAALFHDVGKPKAFKEDINGVGHFYGHWEFSKLTFEVFAARYNIDKRLSKEVLNLIYYHDVNVLKMSDKELSEMCMKLGYRGIVKLFDFKRADLLAQNEKYHYLLNDFVKQKENILSKMKKKLILFDWGNIVESHLTGYTCYDAWNELFFECGYQGNENVFNLLGKYNISVLSEEKFKDEYELMKNDFNLNKSYDEFKKLYYKIFDKIDYYKEVADFEVSLKDKCAIGIFSNLTPLDKVRLEKQIDLSKYDYVFLSFLEGYQKPDFEMYEKIVDNVPFYPEDILFIDDKNINLLPALKMGWKTFEATGLELDKIKNKCENFLYDDIKIDDIKTPEDILTFMNQHIRYGWLDINGEEHIGNMMNFRRLYRTSTSSEVLNHGIGTCIEQVKLMSDLLTKLNIPNKMFCTRIYEGSDYNDLDSSEHMHCFLLYYLNDKVYQIEHPNWERIGIYEFDSEDDAIKKINNYYVSISDGKSRPVTEFFDVQANLSFKEFNEYINSLDIKKDKVDKTL